MPAVSSKQRRFFGMLISNPRKRRAAGVSLKTAREFARKPKSGYHRKRH